VSEQTNTNHPDRPLPAPASRETGDRRDPSDNPDVSYVVRTMPTRRSFHEAAHKLPERS
jgi:hypothetical protein